MKNLKMLLAHLRAGGLALVLALAGVSLAHAAPPTPLPSSVLASQTSLSVSNSSARVAFPAAVSVYSAITVVNVGASDAFFATGDSSVAATTSSKRVGACGHLTFWTGDTYLAAITAGSDTTTLRIYQANGPIDLGQGCGANGPAANVNASIANGADVAEGSTTDAAWNGTDPAATMVAIAKAGYGKGATLATAVGVAGTPNSAVITVQGNASGVPVPVSAASLPLPTGAATSANQSSALARGKNVQLAPTITVQNSAYSAGYSEGGLITVTGAAATNGGGGLVDAIRIKSNGGSTNALWVYLWSKQPASTCTDKSTFVPNTADAPYALPGFPVQVTLGGAPGAWDTSTYAYTSGNTNVSNFKNQDTSPGTAIYACLVTSTSVTPPATGDLSMIVGIIQE